VARRWAAALARLDDAVRVKAAADALVAAGGVGASEWQARVPVLDENCQASVVAAPRAGNTKAGASGHVAPRKVAALLDSDQPTAHAARLEFGDAIGPPSPPPARPSMWSQAGRPSRGRRGGPEAAMDPDSGRRVAACDAARPEAGGASMLARGRSVERPGTDLEHVVLERDTAGDVRRVGHDDVDHGPCGLRQGIDAALTAYGGRWTGRTP
jgi:hypothetical protein